MPAPGTFLVAVRPAVTDENLLTSMFSPSRAPNLYAPGEDEGIMPAPVWAGLLGEFRNRLERVNAGTVQLRDALPSDLGGDLAPALADMESSLDGLFALVTGLEALTSPGEQVISDLADVIDRAVAMAGPWLPAGAQVSVGNRVGAVRNRNRAVECALAAVLITLVKSAEPRLDSVVRHLHIDVFSSRGAVTVEVESLGVRVVRPTSNAWRWWLAERLASVAGGSLEPLGDRAGVGLRFQ